MKPRLYAIATNLVRDRYRLQLRRGLSRDLECAEHLLVAEKPGVEAIRSEDERRVRAAIAIRSRGAAGGYPAARLRG